MYKFADTSQHVVDKRKKMYADAIKKECTQQAVAR